MTVANLGFAIDSSPLASASSELDKLSSSAAKAEQAASRVSGVGTRMSRGFADLNPTLEKIVGALGRLEGISTSIDKRLDAMASAAARAAKGNIGLEKSAIEASTAYKALEASLNAVTAAQSKADAAQTKSLAQIQKQKDSLAALNAELQKLRNAPPPGNPNPNRPSSPANSNFQTSNIAAQLFDIGATAPFMSPTTVGLQQGPQLAQAFAGQSAKQALTGLASGFAAIASPVSLAAIGLTTAAAAAISYGSSILSSLDTSNTAFEKHIDTIGRIKETWESASEAGAQYGRRAQSSIQFDVNQDRIRLNKALEMGLKDFAYRATPQVDASQYDYPGADINAITKQMRIDQFGPFADLLERIVDLAREGKGDILDLNRQVQELANTRPDDKAFQAYAAAILKISENATKAARDLDELRKKEREYRDTFTRTDAAANANRYQADTEYARLSMTRRYDAEVSGIGARSPSERAAAERRRLEAEPIDPKEAPANRSLRIDQQVDLMTRRAQQQLAEAQRDRSLNLDKILSDQQNEIDLIGKTGGAAEALRKQYELTSQLRMEAARQGIDVDQKELDLIKERTKALGEMTDRYNQRRFDFDMNRQASDARLSDRSYRITSTLRQYGMSEDLGSENAARVGQQLDWQQAKDLAKSFGATFSNELIQSGGDIGKSFAKAIQNSLEKSAQDLWQKLFDNVGTAFADMLFGSKSGGSGTIGSAAAAVMGSANDNTAGAFSGLGKVIPVTRADLPPVGAGGSGSISSYIASAASARGIDPDTALRVAKSEGGLNSWNLQSNYMKNGVQEPSFGPFQLYKGGGLGNDFMRKTGLDPALAANGPAGVDFALDHAAKNGWGAWYGAAKVGVGKWDGIGAGSSSAVDAVNGLASASKEATVNLGGFGNGLGKLGQSLSTSFFPSAPSAPSGGGGGGGLFGWLGGLFGGGGGGSLSKYVGLTGLFADGTNYAPGGMAIVGERGPELVNLPQGSQVFDTNRSARMIGGGRESGGNQRPIQNFYLDGVKGDDHLREIARQGAQEGIYQYNQSQQRSGFGENQQAYANRKG